MVDYVVCSCPEDLNTCRALVTMLAPMSGAVLLSSDGVPEIKLDSNIAIIGVWSPGRSDEDAEILSRMMKMGETRPVLMSMPGASQPAHFDELNADVVFTTNDGPTDRNLLQKAIQKASASTPLLTKSRTSEWRAGQSNRTTGVITLLNVIAAICVLTAAGWFMRDRLAEVFIADPDAPKVSIRGEDGRMEPLDAAKARDQLSNTPLPNDEPSEQTQQDDQ